MGSKHGKYVYVKRDDGYYVKVRVLNIRFKKRGKEKYSFDINDPSRYVVLSVKIKKPPAKAQIIRIDDLPSSVRTVVEKV